MSEEKKGGKHDKLGWSLLILIWMLMLLGAWYSYSHQLAQDGIDTVSSVGDEVGGWSGS